MKKILIVGGAGFIGTRLSNTLNKSGHEVHVVDNFWFGDFLDDNIKKTKSSLWSLTPSDLEGYDAVLFLAGLSNDPMAMFRPDLNFIENSSAPVYLGFIAKQAGVKRFICASSCSVYGYTKNKTLNENSPIKPSYAYGISKLQCEQGLTTLEDENFKPIIFRKGTVGGWSPKMRYDLVVNTMLKSALTTNKIIVNNPKLWRPLIDIRDVIQGYEKAIEADLDISGIFNISGVNSTIGDLGTSIHSKLVEMGFDVELIINNNPDVRNYKVSTEKIEDELGYKAQYNPLDSIDEILSNIDVNQYDFNQDIFHNINIFKQIIDNENTNNGGFGSIRK
jgi:nucleoside-diphosphate-sugar epimerase